MHQLKHDQHELPVVQPPYLVLHATAGTLRRPISVESSKEKDPAVSISNNNGEHRDAGLESNNSD